MTPPPAAVPDAPDTRRPPSDLPFYVALAVLSGGYVLLIALLVLADFAYTTPSNLLSQLNTAETRYSIWLSLTSCTITSVLSLWVAVPIGYLMSRWNFPGKAVVDTLLDIPIVLPPLVVGVSLLILFRFRPFAWVDRFVTYEVPGVIVAQFMVACAFAVRTMRVTFDQLNPRAEQVALTLGCSRSQAFWLVLYPQARRGILAGGTLAWARSLGEFGPVLVFAGANPFRTEVLPTTVFLKMQAGSLDGMLAVSLLMIVAAGVVLLVARACGLRGPAIV